MRQQASSHGRSLRPTSPRNRWIGVCIALGAISAAAVWFLFVSHFWSISEIEVYGAPDADRGDVEQASYAAMDNSSWKPWDKRNIFFVNASSVAMTVQQKLFAQSVTVEKDYPNILRLNVVERQRSVVLYSHGQQLLVDTSGAIAGSTDERTGAYMESLLSGKITADANKLPLIVVDLDQNVSSTQVTDEATVKLWIESYRALMQGGVRFRYMAFDRPDSSLARLKAPDNTDVLVDLDLPLAPQIATYTVFTDNKKKTDIVTQYIDVRVPGKIFVK